MTHILEPRARADVLRQYEHYLEHAPAEVAERFLLAVEASIRKLLDFPHIGAPYPCSAPRLAGLRAWPVSDFEDIRIYYLSYEDYVQVIRVLHGRRDLSAVFKA